MFGFVTLVTHTFKAGQSSVDEQVSPGVQVENKSPHVIPPSARVRQRQLAPHTSVQVAHAPAALHWWIGSQQVPLQQTFVPAQLCPAWPFWVGCTPHWPVAALHVWHTGQIGGQTGAAATQRKAKSSM